MKDRIQQMNVFFMTWKGYLTGMILVFFFCSLLYGLSFITAYSSSTQARQDASGFEYRYAKQFIYFYFYTGYFPLATLNEELTFNRAAAEKELELHGDQLIMEYKHWSRLGEHARIFAFLPDAWIKRSPANPSVRLFNALFFTLGLLFLFRGSWKIGYPLTGLFACLLILCTPYYHYEIFRNENIFGLLHSIFYFCIGILLPVLFAPNNPSPKHLALGIPAVLLIAFGSEIRNEISIVLVSVLLLYLLANSFHWIYRLVSIILFCGLFVFSKKMIQYYFHQKFEAATALVKSKGGHVYTGARISGHQFWHPVSCGLGDFDQRYGHRWDDRVAYAYAIPVLKEKYNLDIPYSGELYVDAYYDSAKIYYKKFDEIPEYEEVMKEQVLHQIQQDPSWYASILIQRILRILTTTLPFPLAGWLLFPLLYVLIRKREWTLLKLIVISLPLSAMSFLIYSGNGATYNSVFPFVVIILWVVIGIKSSIKLNSV
ncbi:MAG: hypothetical protein JNJ58_12600 [Chitinophagaceae bacterium]|nr:hypothetical protein [Chitinophagaceae bacterium]